MPWLLIAAVLSTAATVYSGYQSYKAEKANARIAEQNALAAEQKAEYDAKIHRDKVRRILSSQIAKYGKSGVGFEGSPLLALEETVGEGKLDELAILYGGDLEASQQRSQASIHRMQGRTAFGTSLLQGGSTLLAGGMKSYKVKQKTGKWG